LNERGVRERKKAAKDLDSGQKFCGPIDNNMRMKEKERKSTLLRT
jgi:hypothetical protein